MKLIIGLGNPGSEYEKTRHNVGFAVLDALRNNLELDKFKKENKFNAEITTGQYRNQKIVLVKPLTYMNRSGDAVQKISNYFKVGPADCLVICDDLDTPFGKLRIRKKGGPGTHNGLKSINPVLGPEYPRIRIGIENRPPDMIKKTDAAGYVLGRFSNEEEQTLKNIFINTVEASKLIILDEIDEAMNKFN